MIMGDLRRIEGPQMMRVPSQVDPDLYSSIELPTRMNNTDNIMYYSAEKLDIGSHSTCPDG